MKEVLCEEIEGYLDHSKQSIDVNKDEQPTGTLATTFHMPAGEASPYVLIEIQPANNLKTNPNKCFQDK